MPGLTRAEARARAAKAKARDAELEAKVEAWFGGKLRAAILANEECLKELTVKVEAQGRQLQDENCKLREAVNVLEKKLDAAIAEHAKPIARMEEMEKRFSKIDSQLQQKCNALKSAVDDQQTQFTKLRQEYQLFTKSASDRLHILERRVADYPEKKATLQKLKADYDEYVMGEQQRTAYNRRLEFLVKDMEERNWPWRPNMDRSNSPHVKLLRGTAPTNDGPSQEMIDEGLSKLWLSNGQSRPPSREYPMPTLLQAPSVSAGSGLAAARSRPKSAK